ncbi:MAG TPA: outer membrane protein assembly factor BamE [Opitutaceae bacterium]|nr:outer membrane protein assembly factor BamE [Opitutaceae bacterium]
MERYCLLYPGIDTRYAPAFSETAFARIKVGMTREEVTALLGPPLHSSARGTGLRWDYTQDGKCVWADWAWLGRSVVFKEERVVEKISCVWYD